MTSEALERLRQLMRDAGSALVTFSGGVDSALVLAVAHEQLGARALALTADSPTFPPEERALAEQVATQLGERAVRHPLVEVGMTKAMVREAAQALGLPVWDKPSFACLGSRFPVGTRVTLDRVDKVRRVESLLRGFGLRQLRVRYHELDGAAMARVEVAPEDLPVLVSEGIREALIGVCQQEGFRWVTVDLAGYQMGGLSTAVKAS